MITSIKFKIPLAKTRIRLLQHQDAPKDRAIDVNGLRVLDGLGRHNDQSRLLFCLLHRTAWCVWHNPSSIFLCRLVEFDHEIHHEKCLFYTPVYSIHRRSRRIILTTRQLCQDDSQFEIEGILVSLRHLICQAAIQITSKDDLQWNKRQRWLPRRKTGGREHTIHCTA